MGKERLEQLLAALEDPKVSVQWNAARELARLGESSAAAVPALERIAAGSDATARIWAVYALAVIQGGISQRLPVLVEALKDRRVFPGMAAAALAGLGSDSAAAVPALIDAMKSDRPDDRWSAIWALGKIGREAADAVVPITAALRSADEKVRWYAAWALAELGPVAISAANELAMCLTDSDDDVRGYAARALASIGAPVSSETLAVLQDMCDDENPAVAEAAAAAVIALSPRD